MSRALLALAALWLVGCGRQDLDLLVELSEHDDACAAAANESECDANAALGCSFQPNEIGCQSGEPSCQPGSCRAGDPFVRRVERRFLLNGRPFRFAGVSSWGLLPGPPCSDIPADAREAWIQSAYDALVPARSKVARLFAFQSAAGPSGDDFSALDASVRAARRAGVRLQLMLEHASASCSRGEPRDGAWYAGGFRAPDSGYALSYRDYAEALARHYRDEPTVLGYTLVQSLGGADAKTLSAFVTEMGQLLHGVAPNQLVSLDLAWSGSGDDNGASYIELQSLPVVDFVDVDDYDFSEPSEPLDPQLRESLPRIDKPAVIGEGAFRLDGDDVAALERRAERARRRLQDWKSWGFDGALFWAYQPGWTMFSEEFDARAGDPMLTADGVLAHAPW